MAKIKATVKTDPIIVSVVTACVKEALQPFVTEIVKGLLDSRQTMLLQGYVRDILQSGDLINVPIPEVAEDATPATPTAATPVAPMPSTAPATLVSEAPEEPDTLEKFLDRTVPGWSAPPLPTAQEKAALSLFK